jgi:hypothetical protein
VPSSYKKVSLQIYKHACMDGFRSLVWILVFFFLYDIYIYIYPCVFYGCFSDGSFFCMFWIFVILHSWCHQEQVLLLQVNKKVRFFS